MGPERLVRCFIAIDLNEPSIVRKITELQEQLASIGADLKHVEPHNLHLTLWFLGEIMEQRLSVLMDALKGLRFKRFSISLKGLGYFPGGNRINVIWVGVEDGEGNLRKVHSELVRILRPLNFIPEERGFSPHLTVCRVRSPREKARLIELINKNKELWLGSQQVDRVCLKKSTLTPKGPIYEDLLVVSGE